MKKTMTFCVLLTFILLVFSCQDVELLKQDQNYSLTNIDNEINIEFAKILSDAISDSEIRSFIKNEALKQIDNDFDVIYQFVKDIKMSNGYTFRQNLSQYTQSIEHLDSLTNNDVTLTIYVPFLDNTFNAYIWNTETQIPSVILRDKDIDNTVSKLSLIELDGSISKVERYIKPVKPVLVIKSNERIIERNTQYLSNKANRYEETSVNNTHLPFEFLSEEFNNIKVTNKKHVSSTNNVEVSFDLINDDKLLTASMSKNDCARDYVYYGISPVLGTTQGTLDIKYKESIKSVTFDSYSVLTHIDDKVNQSIDADWSDGNLELKFDFTFITKESAISSLTKMISVPINKLFSVDEGKTLTYILSTPIDIFNWDLETFGNIYRIDVSEWDAGTITEETANISSQFGSNFEISASTDVGLFGLKVKVGTKYNSSETFTKSSVSTIKSTNNSDPLGSVFVNFFDPIYNNNKISIHILGFDNEVGCNFYVNNFIINNTKEDIQDFVNRAKFGEFNEEIMMANPFGYNDNFSVILSVNSLDNMTNKYSSSTGMISLLIQPRNIYD